MFVDAAGTSHVEQRHDLPVRVDFDSGRTLLDIAGFQNDAQAILGWDVDVATPQILREEFRDEVLADSRPL